MARAASGGWSRSGCAGISWKPSPRRGPGRHPAGGRFQPRRQLRQRLLRSEPARRLALEHSKAFLWPGASARQSSGADRARARELLFEGNRCVGLRLRRDGRDETAARREVVLAAGAGQYAPAAGTVRRGRAGACARGRHRYPSRAARRGREPAGPSATARVIIKVQGVKTLNRLAATWWGKAGIGLEYLLKRSGPMSMAPSQLGLFARSDEGQPAPTWNSTCSRCRWAPSANRCTASTPSRPACATCGPRRGSVRTQADAQAAPLIQPNYLSTDETESGGRLDTAGAAHRGLARAEPLPAGGGCPVRPTAAMMSCARRRGKIGTTIFHPVGTCAMGRRPDQGAVVTRCDAHGLKGCASPTPPSCP